MFDKSNFFVLKLVDCTILYKPRELQQILILVHIFCWNKIALWLVCFYFTFYFFCHFELSDHNSTLQKWFWFYYLNNVLKNTITVNDNKRRPWNCFIFVFQEIMGQTASMWANQVLILVTVGFAKVSLTLYFSINFEATHHHD